MSISTPVELTSNISNSSATNRPTASYLPTASGISIACCAAREFTGGSPAPDLTISNSHAGSWAWDEFTVSDAATNRHTLGVFPAQTPAITGAGITTFTAAETCNRWEWIVTEVTGGLPDITNFIIGTSTSATPSVTLPNSPASDSVVIGVIASVAHTGTIGAGSGFTTLVQTPTTSQTALHVEYNLAPSGTSVAWTGCGTTSNLLIAFEIPAAAVGIPPSVFVRRRRR